jgi:hypothetical protein
MSHPACPESEFITLIQEHGPTGTARKLGISERGVYERLSRIEMKSGLIPRPDRRSPHPIDVPGRLQFECKNGCIVVGGDAHYWPGVITTAHQAFVKFIKTYKPQAVIVNGDMFDGASISRHAPIAWEKKPSVILELEACKDRLGEIVEVTGKASKFWPLGNHDARFESRLAQAAPEYANVHGLHLADHFPLWEKCWSVWVNDSVVVKHRYKNGIHAAHNNTASAGKTMITNHLHSQKVSPLTDYNGDRWGVDTGTMAEPFGPQFTDYMEDGPRNWRSGFAVLTFENYELLQPELVRVIRPGVVDFRGRTWEM